jgi:hypothetical protein
LFANNLRSTKLWRDWTPWTWTRWQDTVDTPHQVGFAQWSSSCTNQWQKSECMLKRSVGRFYGRKATLAQIFRCGTIESMHIFNWYAWRRAKQKI